MRIVYSTPLVFGASVLRRADGFVSGPTAAVRLGFRAQGSTHISAVGEGFTEAFSRVEQALELSPLDHAEAMGLEAWEVGDNSGTIAGFKGKKVDWVSRCSFQEEDGTTRQCLRAWRAREELRIAKKAFTRAHEPPSRDRRTCGLTAEMDLVAKDDLMYSKDYRNRYYSGAASEWWEKTVGCENITPSTAPMDLRERTLASPVHASFTMPDTQENADWVSKTAGDLVAIWLDFIAGAEEIPRVRRGTMLARDSELRRLWWAVASNDKTLGQRGPEIAAAMAGPGDMGYTGQAS